MNVLLTGSTGMIGESVLLESLDHPDVKRVMIINRRPLGKQHSKLNEVLLKDFTDFSPLRDEFKAFQPDACFHCMGVSSIGMSEADYLRLTLEVGKSLADLVYEINPQAVFNFVSGAGTDETEQGRVMWANVKGQTENYILNRGFKDAYCFRIGAVIPERGVKSSTGWVNILYTLTRPIHGLMKRMDSMITSTQLGQSMVAVVKQPFAKKRLENRDIKATLLAASLG